MRKLAYLAALIPLPALAQQAGWGNLGQKQEEVVTWAKWWTEPLFSGFWMAWTRATLAVFIFIFASIAIMGIIETLRPGGAERDGVLGLTTTRGDRLFLTLLGTAYIFLAWIGLVSMVLWWPLAIAICWGVFCFWKV